MQQFFSFLSWRLFTAQHVSGVSRPSSGAQWLQWQPLVLPSYRGDSRAVFVVGPAGRPDQEHFVPYTHVWSCTMLGVICVTLWRDILRTRNDQCGKPVADPKLKLNPHNRPICHSYRSELLKSSLDTILLDIDVGTPGNGRDMRSRPWSLEFGRACLIVGYWLITEVRSCLGWTISLNPQTACIEFRSLNKPFVYSLSGVLHT
jgi:hypothetical protein